MEKKKVLMAFSGGLDTSFCVKYRDLRGGWVPRDDGSVRPA